MLEGIFLMLAPVAIVVGLVFLLKLGLKRSTQKNEEQKNIEQEQIEANKEAIQKRVNTLIAQGKTNVFDKNGNSLLMYALRNQLFEEADRLIQLGVSPQYANKEGETALHLLAAQNQKDLLAQILKKGTRPDIPDKKNRTPLHAATISNAPEATAMLINAGADVNIQEKDFGFTPLMMALKRGYIQVAENLLNKGSNLMLKNIDGQTAVEVGHDALAKVITTEIGAKKLREIVMKMEAQKEGKAYFPKSKTISEDDHPDPYGETMGNEDS
jgi:ankyrin repeat protein